jgi:nucleotide-binding universal stress UspA family protein
MQDIQRILVPTDFSEVSHAALSMALQLASDYGLVSAPNDDVIESAIRDGEKKILDAVQLEQDRAKKAGKTIKSVPLKMFVTGGEWLDVTLSLIDEHELDLVVTGTHGGKGIKSFFLGSMSEQLVRKASCSTFVVKPQGYPYLRD